MSSQIKKLVIADIGCKDVGHELLNAMSIEAAGLELGIPVTRYLRAGKNPLIQRAIWLYAKYLQRMHRKEIVEARREITFLPPTKPFTKSSETLYFFGWPFRNPVGLTKYRAQLLKLYGPTKSELRLINKKLANTMGKKLIGVHLHQTPFKGFEDGEFLVPHTRVSEMVEEYLAQKRLTKEDVALVLVSDTKLLLDAFKGFATRTAVGDTKTNLHLLTKCSVVIGDNSIYSNVAAWFGNIPHLVTTPEPIDWEYYAGKTTYFENKCATFTF